MTTAKLVLLMIGSAIAGVAIFVIGVVAFFTYTASRTSETTFSFPGPSPTRVGQPPALDKSARFLGTMGTFGSEFKHASRGNELSAGPGQIVGVINKDGKPMAGVPIRLALNGSVMSQWAKTGADGKYAIAVPYGEYRIDGYELEPRQVDRLLGGKTDSPRNWGYHRTESFRVAEATPGRGLELDYIDPVVVVAPKGDVPASQPIVLKWQPYPNATSYRLQLEEFKRGGDFQNERWLFDWSERPVVEGTTFDLGAKGLRLKPGYHYQVRIEALDASRRVVSSTGNRFAVTDFHLTE